MQMAVFVVVASVVICHFCSGQDAALDCWGGGFPPYSCVIIEGFFKWWGGWQLDVRSILEKYSFLLIKKKY